MQQPGEDAPAWQNISAKMDAAFQIGNAQDHGARHFLAGGKCGRP